MNFYSRVIFPLGYDFFMSSEPRARCRQELLKAVYGKVLEIGFGTGLNLPFYPASVESLSTVDKNPAMSARAYRKISESAIKVSQYPASAESLPFADGSFDCVVTAYCLCSVRHVDAALQEIRRVLKSDGRYHFLEHGLSVDSSVRKWQHRINPMQKLLADGCHINRKITHLVQSNNFEIRELKEFYMEGDPKTHGYTYLGMANRQD